MDYFGSGHVGGDDGECACCNQRGRNVNSNNNMNTIRYSFSQILTARRPRNYPMLQHRSIWQRLDTQPIIHVPLDSVSLVGTVWPRCHAAKLGIGLHHMGHANVSFCHARTHACICTGHTYRGGLQNRRKRHSLRNCRIFRLQMMNFESFLNWT